MTDPCDDISGPAAPTHHGHWPHPVHGMAPVHHLPLRIKIWLATAGCTAGGGGVIGGGIWFARKVQEHQAHMWGLPEFQEPMTDVPEPGTLALMILPLVALVILRWRMR